MAKQGFYDSHKEITERKGFEIEIATNGFIDPETAELFEFEKVFAEFVGKTVSFSIKVQIVEEDIAEIE